MTRWFSSACHCVLDIPDKPYNELGGVFVEQCRTHDRPNEVFAHCRRTPEDKRSLEKKKPQFQRRSR